VNADATDAEAARADTANAGAANAGTTGTTGAAGTSGADGAAAGGADGTGADEAAHRVDRRAATALAVVGLVWLAATFVTAHASVVGNADVYPVALGAAAFALPNLVAAALVAGATTGLAVASWLAWADRPVRRLLTGLAAGAVLGGVSAGLVAYGYGTGGGVAGLAATVAAAAVLGGVISAGPPPVLAAGLLGTIGTLLLGLVTGLAQPTLVNLFGGSRGLDAQVNATYTVAYLVGVAGGVVAGAASFWLLRRHGPRAWPWYLLTGALPGILLLVAEATTRIGGSGLLDLVRSLSEGDRLTVDIASFARLRNAMIVAFVGGLTAMLAVGRTLRAR
jgi:Mg/Co/Ni transporter MgtE (contains CBS domain)